MDDEDWNPWDNDSAAPGWLGLFTVFFTLSLIGLGVYFLLK